MTSQVPGRAPTADAFTSLGARQRHVRDVQAAAAP